MPRSLSKYRIGLGLIGIFTLALLILVVTQASATKQDNVTYNQANKAADKLNNYTENYSLIPASLTAVGANNLSPNISYHKVSDTSYRFCVTYKAASSGFNTTTVEQNIVTAAAGQGTGFDSSATDNTALLIDTTHHKGQNCQTIKPYLYNDGGTSLPSNTPTYTPATPSTPSSPTTPVVSKEQLSKPPDRRPPQYVHICTDTANITYVSQGTPDCLPGGTFQSDYGPTVAGTYYSVPCQTVNSAVLRYVYISSNETCPRGTAAVN